MISGNDFDQTARDRAEPLQPVLFAARLTPHRSLNRTGFLAVMICVSSLSFVAGIAFLLMGAWPVFGFFCLDLLVIYWAFKVNFRRAAAYEDIRVSYSELRLQRVSHRGHSMEWMFNPLWVQIKQETHEEFGLERLYLVSRGRHVGLASFLSPEEKLSFYKALSAALQEARRGPTYNPVN